MIWNALCNATQSLKYISRKVNSLGSHICNASRQLFPGCKTNSVYSKKLLFYLQARLSWRGARLLRPLLQFMLLMLAVYTGLTRISDYRHHPTDVLTSFLQGGLTAYWVVRITSPHALDYPKNGNGTKNFETCSCLDKSSQRTISCAL
uniref:Phosphatidic acid phosphatase type 2/haloperoxidase domain-containing protein n=1 Tax=Sinocyclocheilus rhinocerous TaxID=307959 RepID=A0A673NHU8_9TELE